MQAQIYNTHKKLFRSQHFHAHTKRTNAHKNIHAITKHTYKHKNIHAFTKLTCRHKFTTRIKNYFVHNTFMHAQNVLTRTKHTHNHISFVWTFRDRHRGVNKLEFQDQQNVTKFLAFPQVFKVGLIMEIQQNIFIVTGFLAIFLASPVASDCVCQGDFGVLCRDTIYRQDLLHCPMATRLVSINATFIDCNLHYEVFPNLSHIDISPSGSSSLCKYDTNSHRTIDSKIQQHFRCLDCSSIPEHIIVFGCPKCTRRNRESRIQNTPLPCLDRNIDSDTELHPWMKVIMILTCSILFTTSPVLLCKLQKACKLHKVSSGSLKNGNRHGHDSNNSPLSGRQPSK